MTPKEARAYISEIRFQGMKPEYVEFESGRRVYFKFMTDDEAIMIANQLAEMVAERARRDGKLQ